eukprot:95359-Pyramimonas_sp.AAC.1
MARRRSTVASVMPLTQASCSAARLGSHPSATWRGDDGSSPVRAPGASRRSGPARPTPSSPSASMPWDWAAPRSM